jgi:hypothetical protein
VYYKFYFAISAAAVLALCSYSNAQRGGGYNGGVIVNGTNNRDDRPWWNGPAPVLQPPDPKLSIPVTKDEATVHLAQLALNSVNKSLKDIQDKLQAAFEAKPEWVKSVKDVGSAKDALGALTKTAKDKLASSPGYVLAKSHSDNAEAQLAAARDSGNSSAIATWATAKLDAAAKVTKMENDALAKDPKIQSAQESLKTAKATLDALHAQFMASLSDNTDWAAAKAKADDAKTQFTTANIQMQADKMTLAQDQDQKLNEYRTQKNQYDNSRHNP